MSKEVFSSIVLYNYRHERRNLSKLSCMSREGVRRNPEREKVPDKNNIRPAFWHDADRILHSNAYARYIDKTQAFYLFENDHITRRVLHVQLVSKIGRLIARSLRLNEDLVEAIGLGHDLGHVPYGHDGETFLNEICQEQKIGSFCHNAQSVRFLMELEQSGAGLNITLQVLDGILAHNGEIIKPEYRPHTRKSWDQFLQEYEACQADKNNSLKLMAMTLEGCIVRISDVIGYIGRDIEDAIRLNVMDREEIPTEVVSILGNNNGDIINKLVLDLIENSYGKNHLQFSDKIFKALKQLLDFNTWRIYKHPPIRSQEVKIRRMFQSLFTCYLDHLNNENIDSSIYTHFLKNMNKEYLDRTDSKRIVIDYIAGMTDDFFNNEFERLFMPKSYGYCL